MSEEKKEEQPSGGPFPTEQVSKAAPAILQPKAQSPSQPTKPSVAQAPAPKPLGKIGRRTFIKFLTAVGALLALAPYVPFGEFLSSSVSFRGGYDRQRVVIDADPVKFGAASGRAVKVDDLDTFPPNSNWVVTYPTSGDSVVDAQNTDTFLKFELIRLPKALGGDSKQASAFVVFSKVCVHLWCSPNYIPAQGHMQYECPCHGSTYRVPDGLAVGGPAAFQPPPANVIPMLTLSTDKDGFLYIEKPIWDLDNNGVLGYGRYIKKK